jgi:hypothetical protein
MRDISYSLAVISALFIGLVLFLLSKRIRISEPYLLIIDSKDIKTGDIENILKKYTLLYKLRSKTVDKEKSQLIVEIKIKKNKIQNLLEGLKSQKDITFVKLVSYEGDLEEA